MKSIDEILLNPKAAIDKESALGIEKYKGKTMVAVDVAAFTSDAVCLGQRLWYPYGWAIPGGKVDDSDYNCPKAKINPDYAFVAAAIREFSEETGVKLVEGNARLFKLGVYDAKGRDPRGNFVSHAFVGIVNDGVQVKGSDDLGFARWFSLSDARQLVYMSEGLTQYVKDRKLIARELISTDAVFGKSVVNVLAFDHWMILRDAFKLYDALKANPGAYASLI